MNEEQCTRAVDAIVDRLHEVIPGVVVGFIGYVSIIDHDGDRAWMSMCLPDQDPHMTRGMAELHLDIIKADDMTEEDYL